MTGITDDANNRHQVLSEMTEPTPYLTHQDKEWIEYLKRQQCNLNNPNECEKTK